MNYQKHYDKLIEKYGTWEKPKGIYTERHRKFPGYLGGKYIKGNAFYVPARVHYLAHLLWAKITEHPKAWEAVKGMCEFKGRRRSKAYETARIRALPSMKENGIRAARKLIERGKGITAIPFETRSELSRKTAKRMYEEGTGLAVVPKWQRIEAGLKAFRDKTGVHARSKDQMIKDAKKGGDIVAALKLGFSIPGAAVKAGKKCAEMKRGIHGLAPEKRSAISVVAAAVTNSLLYRCSVCGLEKRPCELGHHQKSTGHAGKERIK